MKKCWFFRLPKHPRSVKIDSERKQASPNTQTAVAADCARECRIRNLQPATLVAKSGGLTGRGLWPERRWNAGCRRVGRRDTMAAAAHEDVQDVSTTGKSFLSLSWDAETCRGRRTGTKPLGRCSGICRGRRPGRARRGTDGDPRAPPAECLSAEMMRRRFLPFHPLRDSGFPRRAEKRITIRIIWHLPLSPAWKPDLFMRWLWRIAPVHLRPIRTPPVAISTGFRGGKQ